MYLQYHYCYNFILFLLMFIFIFHLFFVYISLSIYLFSVRDIWSRLFYVQIKKHFDMSTYSKWKHFW